MPTWAKNEDTTRDILDEGLIPMEREIFKRLSFSYKSQDLEVYMYLRTVV